ncbi:MAG: S8 family serine peptidase [Pseudomonadota bacterium]
MTIRKLAMPWAAAGERTYCLPTSFMVTLQLGEAPDEIPALFDVRGGHARAAARFDGGPLDRIVGRYAGAVRIARLHSARASWQLRGQRNARYDALEQTSGVARTFLVQVAPGTAIGNLVRDLAQLSKVSSASPNYVSVSPFELGAAGAIDTSWAPHLMVRAPEALAHEPGDNAVLIGLVDSGVVNDHAELMGRMRAGLDTVNMSDDGVSPGIRLLGEHSNYDSNPRDQYVGHGMACAGIMSGLGLQLAPGLAGESQIIPMRALAAAQLPGRAAPVGLGSISDLDAAVKLAVDLGAKIINMSFGTDDSALSPDSPKPHADVVKYALEHGCILVAASGNNGQWTRYWPAAHPDVIAVGAVGDERLPTAFSTRGEHVALCAPGERILTTGLTAYQNVTGTSFAAPFVAAACALLVARGARRAMPVDGAFALKLLTESCQPFGPRPATGCGAGILDAAAALVALDAMIDRLRDGEETEDG